MQAVHWNRGDAMTYLTEYETPIIGTLTLSSDGTSITGCWFDNDRYFGYGIDEPVERKDDLAVFELARRWLDRYFAGDAPDPRELPLAARATAFQQHVREAMLDIPYGQTTTYGAIAKRIEQKTGKRQSARAVGGAVGHNPLCLIVPCHRVVGSNGSLTGFGGGIDMKIKLLEHEHAMKDSFKRPKKGTALEGTPDAARAWRDACEEKRD
jgi:methylated-DNA-[protein]-cysteine S-methyltransferase